MSIWLAFLKKYQYYGVGMKANVFEHSNLGVAEELDAEAERIQERLGEKMELFGRSMSLSKKKKDLDAVLHTQPFKAQWGAHAPMAANQTVPPANQRVEPQVVTGDARR